MKEEKSSHKTPPKDPHSWDHIGKWSWDVPEQQMVVPDWRSYKIDGIPELEYVRDTLAARGLKDPWLRNEVWRYPAWVDRNPMNYLRRVLLKWGFREGFCIAAGIISCQYAYYKYTIGGYPPYVSTLWDWFHAEWQYTKKPGHGHH